MDKRYTEKIRIYRWPENTLLQNKNTLLVFLFSYNAILDTVPEAGSWGSNWVYTGLKRAA